MQTSQERHVIANGVSLWTATQGRGTPLVLCHGGPGAYDNLGPVADMIDDIATVFRYDQRGCGRSDRRPPYDITTYIDDLDALREHWGLGSWVLAGHSWGASLALGYCLTFPDRVIGFVSIAGGGISNDWSEEYHRNSEARLAPIDRRRFLEVTAMLETADGSELAKIREERSRLLEPTNFFDASQVSPMPNHDEFPVNFQVNSIMGEASDMPNVAENVPRLDVPALIVHPEGDPRPSWPSRELADLLPQGRFESLPKAGHEPWFEQPDALRLVLRKFLEGLITTSPSTDSGRTGK